MTSKIRRGPARVLLGHCLALLGALSSAGCYKATFVDDPSALDREPTHEEWNDHFLLGLTGEHTHDGAKLCPHGVSVVRTRGDALTGLVTIGTLGIYAPRKVELTCREPETAKREEVTP